MESAVQRIKVVETSMSDGRVAFTELKGSQAAMKDSLDKINGTLSKLNWTIILAVLGAVLGLVIKAAV